MPCEVLELPGGGSALVCSRSRRHKVCSICSRDFAQLLCDGRDTGSRDTCDAPMCRRCALHAPGDKDYCPRHTHQARLQRQLPFINERSR